MARNTRAYSSFLNRLGEVENLRSAAEIKERLDAVKHASHINALCRGSVVLLSAHLEAYVRELGEITLEAIVKKRVDRSRLSHRFFYHISKPVLTEIRESSDPDKIGAKVFDFLSVESGYWARSGPFSTPIQPDIFGKGFSNPAYSKITSYLKRFGYDKYTYDLKAILQSDYLHVINMVDHLVDVRNKIAHGDPTASKTPTDVKAMMSTIRRFCGVTDSAFATWCRANLCSIR